MRVLVADHRSRVRFALRALLKRRPGVEIVAEAANGEELLAHARAFCPDLVLFDWDLQRGAAADLLSTLRGIRRDLCVIVLGGWPEAREPALGAGADGYVSKMAPPEDLLGAIQAVQQRVREKGLASATAA